MARGKQFTLGNQLWKFRSKSGYDPKFTEPDKLWEAACEYFTWVDGNPLINVEVHGKNAVYRELPKMRPYTLSGLYLFMGVNHSYFSDAKERLSKVVEDFTGTKKPSEVVKLNNARAMLFTIERIEQTIFVQKFEGAAAGLMSPVIIARDLGLTDKQEQKVDGKQEIVVRYERKNRNNAQ